MSFVGDIIGSAIGADATREASNTQADATREGIGEQRRQYDLTRADYAPWREAGQNALGQLQTQMGRQPSASEVMAMPGYQFGMQQGQNALDRQFARAGGRVSGAAMKAGARYANDYATTKYNDAYSKTQDTLNRLAAIAGLGQTATGGTAAAGTTAAGNISNMTTAQGNAAGAAQLARGSIWGNALTRLGSSFGGSAGSANAFGGLNSWGSGSGLGYGNEDLGQYF